MKLMKSADVRKKYLTFFTSRGHVEIPSAPLVPENDPTTLFTSSGMQPLVPYLLGQPHPSGKRLVNSQKSFRSQDIEEVGDNRHTTFFEMLGNWSLGDYFKKEQLPWIFEFLTRELGLDPKRLLVTVFEGDRSVPKDTESIEIWKEIFSGVGIEAKLADAKALTGKGGERIFAYPAKKNWWSRSGEPEKMPPGEPGGPDSEVFFDFGPSTSSGQARHTSAFGPICHPNCDCGRFLEIANSVFMQYQKMADGSLKELSQKNVDFGGGLERLVAATNDNPDIFQTDFFIEAIKSLEAIRKAGEGYSENPKPYRIIADHLRAALFMVADGVVPSNKAQGYVLRRLLRRSMVYARTLGMQGDEWLSRVLPSLAQSYRESYPHIDENLPQMNEEITREVDRFRKTIEKGLGEIEKLPMLDGKQAFFLYESYGFPWELTEEIALEKQQTVDRAQFEEEFKKHQELSRTAAAGMFKGGLADHSEQTIKLHTAHHLLLAALQKVIDPAIKQRGSNITAQRLRMDFNFGKKLTPEDLKKAEALVNEKIKENLPVRRVEMAREEAEKIGAQMEFGHKYPDRVSVYLIGLKDKIGFQAATPADYFSAEFCGGPHVAFTGTIGHFTINKEESAGAGVRRIYASVR